MPDYYNVLRLGHNATRKDITQAYERLMKESQYDTTIDRVAVETAYRVLSDIAAKAQYDARQTIKLKRIQGKGKRANRPDARSFLAWFTTARLLAILGILILATVGFYWFRFGYKLQSFQAGDILYDRVQNTRYGKVLRVEDHQFKDGTEKAYLIELDKSKTILGNTGRTIWLQQDVVKACCYKP